MVAKVSKIKVRGTDITKSFEGGSKLIENNQYNLETKSLKIQ